jgi:hypothetical protein
MQTRVAAAACPHTTTTTTITKNNIPMPAGPQLPLHFGMTRKARPIKTWPNTFPGANHKSGASACHCRGLCCCRWHSRLRQLLRHLHHQLLMMGSYLHLGV